MLDTNIATLIELLIASLAVWRLCYMITAESGPFDIFERARYELNRLEERNGHAASYFLHKLVSCIYCLSIWSAAIFTIINWHNINIVQFVIYTLFISSTVIFINNIHRLLLKRYYS